MLIKIIIGSFLISWIFIIYEIITAPLCDEYGNIINKDKTKNKNEKTINNDVGITLNWMYSTKRFNFQ